MFTHMLAGAKKKNRCQIMRDSTHIFLSKNNKVRLNPRVSSRQTSQLATSYSLQRLLDNSPRLALVLHLKEQTVRLSSVIIARQDRAQAARPLRRSSLVGLLGGKRRYFIVIRVALFFLGLALPLVRGCGRVLQCCQW